MTQILGISSSPARKGNTETLLDHMMQTARGFGCDTKSVKLSGIDIKECIHCNSCIGKQKDIKLGSLEDKAGLKSAEMIIKRAVEVTKNLGN